jgi:D-3-phosphoglycerate dehydrogenase
MTRKIQTLNAISKKGLSRLPDSYLVGNDIADPDAILVRSQVMHELPIAASVLAIGRAGAGTNNIPTKAMSERGVVVFNAPGANANAVKELVIAGMLMGTRNIAPALTFVNGLFGDDESLHKQVEAGKKHFVGHELRGSTLGIIGLGAIGSMLAESAIQLGMNVVGFDPEITVDAAWRLPSQVKKAASIDDLVKRCDFISLHVPLLPATKDLINADRVKLMKKGCILLNFARDGIVNEKAVLDGLNDGKLQAYVCDFPSNLLRHHPRFVALPHLGASTEEAEENCAIMVADQVRDYLDQRQHPQFGQLPEHLDAARIRLPAGDRQRQRSEHARPDLNRARRRRVEHPQHGEQVAWRPGLHAGRRRMRGAAGRHRPIDGDRWRPARTLLARIFHRRGRRNSRKARYYWCSRQF